MLSTPYHGWTDILIGDFVGRGSYIQDIPSLLMESFLRALRWNIPAEVTIDEEGSEFEIHSLDTTSIIVRRETTESYHFPIDVRTLATELLADLRRDWQSWVEWASDSSPKHAQSKDLAAIYNSRADHLLRLMKSLEKYL